jgi:CO/xanthine dehydrogenase FAD-binding subunit
VKPAAFDYYDPRTVEEALALLARYGEEGKLLAGGQSLVPILNFRLSKPQVLIDLNRIPALAYIRPWDGGLAIGAMTRQRAAERSPLVRERCPLLAEALPLIGHAQIRNRGTIGGSLAHADPAAELPSVATALEAELVVRGSGGERVVRPSDFFVSYLTTSLEPTEILVEIRVPAWPEGAGWAFAELSRRHGDFAIVGVAAIISLGADSTCTAARLAIAGAAPTPLRARRAEQALVGCPLGAEAIAEAAAAAARQADPEPDIHASAEYRREMVRVFTTRAIRAAAGRATRA